jgi:hypothetical protein
MTALPLGNVIAQAKLAEFQKHEKAMEARLGAGVMLPWQIPLPDRQRAQFDFFAGWCSQNSVRSIPATPSVVATFISEMMATRGTDFLLDILEAIVTVHDYWNLANPVATATVAMMLVTTEAVDPPRSFTKEEKLVFAGLPRDIQGAVARREKNRDDDLRRKQNELAEERKRLKDGADKPVELNEKEISNANEDKQTLGLERVSAA